jgi:hypothetical protein
MIIILFFVFVMVLSAILAYWHDDINSVKPALSKSEQIKILEQLMYSRVFEFRHIVSRLKRNNKYKDKYKKLEDLPLEIISEYIRKLKKMPKIY